MAHAHDATWQLEWKDPDVDGLIKFLVEEKGFKSVTTSCGIVCLLTYFFLCCSEERVRKGAEKLQKFLNAKQQGRLDGFFTVQPKEPKEDKGKGVKGKGKDTKGKDSKEKGTKGGAKRKAEDKSEESTNKKSKSKK